jgi:hypothetical protein
MTVVERRDDPAKVRARRWRMAFWHRRKVARALDVVLLDLDPPRRPIPPSTFGLTDEELRAHANDLHAAGWPIEEIVSVLAINVAERP